MSKGQWVGDLALLFYFCFDPEGGDRWPSQFTKGITISKLVLVENEKTQPLENTGGLNLNQ